MFLQAASIQDRPIIPIFTQFSDAGAREAPTRSIAFRLFRQEATEAAGPLPLLWSARTGIEFMKALAAESMIRCGICSRER